MKCLCRMRHDLGPDLFEVYPNCPIHGIIQNQPKYDESFRSDPLTPYDFGGTDEESHYMAQTKIIQPAQTECICHETVDGKFFCPVHGAYPKAVVESAEAWVDDHISMGWTRADAILGLTERDAAIKAEARTAAIREAAYHVAQHSCVSSCCNAQPSASEANELAGCVLKLLERSVK